MFSPAQRRNLSITLAEKSWSGFRLSETGENKLRADMLVVRGNVAVNKEQRWREYLPYQAIFMLKSYQKGLGMSRIFGQGLELLNQMRGLSCVCKTTQSSKGTAGSNQNGVPWKLDILRITFPT